jgi:hypothetical protein
LRRKNCWILKHIFVYYIYGEILVKFHEAPYIHIVGQQYGVPQGILYVFILIFYEMVFQNQAIFPTQVSLSPEQSNLQPWFDCVQLS